MSFFCWIFFTLMGQGKIDNYDEYRNAQDKNNESVMTFTLWTYCQIFRRDLSIIILDNYT